MPGKVPLRVFPGPTVISGLEEGLVDVGCVDDGACVSGSTADAGNVAVVEKEDIVLVVLAVSVLVVLGKGTKTPAESTDAAEDVVRTDAELAVVVVAVATGSTCWVLDALGASGEGSMKAVCSAGLMVVVDVDCGVEASGDG